MKLILIAIVIFFSGLVLAKPPVYKEVSSYQVEGSLKNFFKGGIVRSYEGTTGQGERCTLNARVAVSEDSIWLSLWADFKFQVSTAGACLPDMGCKSSEVYAHRNAQFWMAEGKGDLSIKIYDRFLGLTGYQYRWMKIDFKKEGLFSKSKYSVRVHEGILGTKSLEPKEYPYKSVLCNVKI